MNIVGLNELENLICEYVSDRESISMDNVVRVISGKTGQSEQVILDALDALFVKKLLTIPTKEGYISFEFPKDDGSNQMEAFEKMADLMPIFKMTHGIPAPNPYDPVNKPKGYNQGKISPADFIADQKLSFDRGSCVKYLCRAGVKEDPELTVEEKAIQDLSKAIWYLQHEIDWIKVNGL